MPESYNILNWLLEGLRNYYERGLTPPEEVTAAVAEYAAASDKLQNYINDCLERDPDANISIKDAYKLYSECCQENGYGVDGKKNFIAEVKQRNLFKDTGTVNGLTVHNVIVGYKQASDFVPVSSDTETPFK